ncbi:MAG: DnaB-like helicase C-terminal domain-containing protein, partial [Selenomonadaceae bacterium]|nr:DnaB-like helicase C-terminal domain-containing protein [Selenomonadaceae bacterium]
DTMGITLPEIKMKSRRVKREHGLDLIVIDYLQLMQSSKRYKGDRVQEVSELSRGIKGLARDLDVPVLALSQLSRGVEYRADKRPMLSDLRESGSIEQDADIVMFIYRDDYYDRESEKQGLAEVIVAKNRNGATGAVGLQFDKARLKFTEPTRPA